MTRATGIFTLLFLPFLGLAQGGDQQLRAKADGLYNEKRYAEAMPLYSQLVSLSPGDRDLNHRFGTTLLFAGDDKEKAIGHLKYAVEDPAVPPVAWYWMGRAYHLNYRFKDALAAYQRYRGVADKKTLAAMPVDDLEQQCRNGLKLISKLKDITVRSKVEAAESEFFRFYDLSDIGGRIVVTPDELKSALDKKNKLRGLVYLPDKGGPIYFSSYGKDGRTGLDIYRTELLPDGKFTTPEKLAGFINTDFDEDHAFMHPDGRTFYFSSKGHSSMGGYDVFRATYDPGMDAFGRPENMDFAVNTPDDDILYVVDADQKEACFASGRNSRQGKLHVYRVSTAHVPLVITVLQGTYANEFDAGDRRARIVVEDALTREQVTETRTDINGSYVLTLPRSGRFRFFVECGPSGKTHSGQVDVPRSETPKGYRQELTLTRQGDMERLVIRNYFEEPLDGDLIAIALEEIKRRARLDVTGPPAMAAQEEPEAQEGGDLLTQAGLSGDMERDDVVRMAREDAEELAHKADELENVAAAAYTLAIDAVAEAERNAREAEALVVKATGLQDGEERNALMVEAALSRQRSREAGLRAQAAHRTGKKAEEARLTARQQAIMAEKLATDLRTSLSAGRDKEALPHLIAFKERLDARSGPAGRPDLAEHLRRITSEQEQEAARTLREADAKRAEENELTDRMSRLRREMETTRSKSRKEELEREIAEYEVLLPALRQEADAVFAKARVLEREAVVTRGSTGLARHLSNTGTDVGKGPDLSEADGLERRIAGVRSRTEALKVEERYDARIPLRAADAESRSFAWATPVAAIWSGTERETTRTHERSDPSASTPRSGATGHSVGRDEDDRTALAGKEREEEPGRMGLRVSEDDPVSSHGAPRSGGTSVDVSVAGEDRTSGVNATRMEDDLVSAAPSAVLPTDGVEGAHTADGQVKAGEGDDAVDTFLIENEIAELRQLLKAERDRAKREEIRTKIEELDRRLLDREADILADGQEEPGREQDVVLDEIRAILDDAPVGGSRIPLVFGKDVADDELVSMVYADHAADERNLMRLEDADERAAGLHGLELMLADSLRAEMARQVTILELDPSQAGRVLPRVDRLRRLRETRLERADEHLRTREADLSALAAGGEEVPPRSSDRRMPDMAGRSGMDRINGRFVVIESDPFNVYNSTVHYRSPKLTEAVALKDADVARMEELQRDIDSLSARTDRMSTTRERDREMKRTDRLRDDMLITRTDLGQRSAFLSKEEWSTATDSLKGLEKELVRKGLPATEPLLVMQRGMRDDAAQLMAQAAEMRKKADRTEDILQRDSLYRSAFETELRGLREMDRAITVSNHLLSDRHVRGESLSYATVASRLFGISLEDEPSGSEAESPVAAKRRTVGQDEGMGGPQGSPDADRVAPLEDEPRATVTGSLAPEVAAGGVPEVSDAVERARNEAETLAFRQESAMEEKARKPVTAYEEHLSAGDAPRDMIDDGSALALAMTQAVTRAREEEERAALLAGRAVAMEDSAAGIRNKRERERLERVAAEVRAEAGSARASALRKAEEAREAEAGLRAAQERKALHERLLKFYYLSTDEQEMVLDDTDRSRYFQARAKALEQYDAATEASEAARVNREFAAVLRQRAEDGAAGITGEAGREEWARVLRTRSEALMLRADSLDDVSRRLRGAAAINEGQASLMLQGMPPDDATGLMALEMRSRRIEPLLGEARGQAGARPPAPVPVEPSLPVVPRDAEVPDMVAPIISAAPSPSPLPRRLVTDVFELRSTEERTATPITMDAEMPEGLVFKVQVGAFSKPVPESTFSDMTPVMGERVGNGLIRYTAGLFTSFEQASVAKDKVRGRGYRDAFVVAYRDGLRIPLGEAMREARDIAAATEGREPRPTMERASEAPVPEVRTSAAGMPSEPAPVTATIARPSTVPPPASLPVSEEDAVTILAAYPASAEAIVGSFVPEPGAAGYYNVPGAAPARQVETIRGLFFTVQVGVYSKPVALDKLFGISPLNSERIAGERIRYTTGIFRDMEEARSRKDDTVRSGVKDAFVTAYLNGKRIPIRDAGLLLERHGPAILAMP